MCLIRCILIFLLGFCSYSAYSQSSPDDVYNSVRKKNKRLPVGQDSTSRTNEKIKISPTKTDTLQFITGASDTSYHINLDGRLDWQNTYTHYNTDIEIAFQPNVKLVIENVGDKLIINPQILQEGRDFYTLENIVKSFTSGATTDLDRLYLIWNNIRKNSYHSSPLFINNELHDPVKFFNSYGMGLCDDISQSLIPIYYTSNFHEKFQNINPYNRDLNGHFMAESAYRGKNVFMDPDLEVFYLDRENEYPLSAEELTKDHDLARKEVVYGNLFEGWKESEKISSLFGADDYVADREYPNHDMNYVLRPGERIIYKWENIGKHIKQFKDYNIEPPYYGNSKVVYSPKFKESIIDESTIENYNIEFYSSKNIISTLKDSAAIAFNFDYPYAIVGGRIKGKYYFLSDNEFISIQIKTSEEEYKEVKKFNGKGEKAFSINLDSLFQNIDARPYYEYQIRIIILNKNPNLDNIPRIGSLSFETDVMCWPLSLPQLTKGSNKITFKHDSKEDVKTKIRHIYQENSQYENPSKPSAIYPEDKAVIEDSITVFKWNEVERCTRYHLQVSLRKDFLFPYRPSFDVIIDSLQWGAPFLGIFSPDTIYFWRVRAQDENMVWSEWSNINSFQWKGPRVPLDVQVIKHPSNPEKLVLSWKNNPRGTKPVKYEIYASNEKGFRASKVKYTSVIDDNLLDATYLTTVSDTSLILSDFEALANEKLKVFYRVVAIDAFGTPSGSSNYAEIETPYFDLDYPKIMMLKDTFSLTLNIIQSSGDLQYRYELPQIDYWEKEDYQLSLIELPKWIENHGSNKFYGIANETGKHKFSFSLSGTKDIIVEDFIWVSESPTEVFYSINNKIFLEPYSDTIYVFSDEYVHFELPWVEEMVYQWFRDEDDLLSQKYQMKTPEEGSFSYRLINNDSIFVSNGIHVTTFKQAPKISYDSNNLYCTDDSIKLEVDFAEFERIQHPEVVWFKDDSVLQNNDEKFIFVNSSGKYHYVIKENNLARSSSDTVEIFDVVDNINLTYQNGLLYGDVGFKYYNWIKDGIQISRSEVNYLLINESGLYELVVEDDNGCSSENIAFFVDLEKENAKDEIYFNNFLNELIIKDSSLMGEELTVSVFSITGQKLISENFLIRNQIERISINLHKGFYVSNILFKTGRQVKLKFIIY